MVKIQKMIYESCSMQHASYHRSLKKKLVIIWKKINFKVKTRFCLTYLELLYALSIYFRTPTGFFVPWHIGIHHFRTKMKGSFYFIEIKILTIWQICKWCWSLQYLNLFLEFKVWGCIRHCREGIGCNMDHYYILTSKCPSLLKCTFPMKKEHG